MKTFAPVAFDYVLCKKELTDFERLFADNTTLDERGIILPFFKTHPQAAALVGSGVSGGLAIGTVDRIAWEYDLFGEYAADLVLGDSAGVL